jgi:hypothetical protein
MRGVRGAVSRTRAPCGQVRQGSKPHIALLFLWPSWHRHWRRLFFACKHRTAPCGVSVRAAAADSRMFLPAHGVYWQRQGTVVARSARSYPQARRSALSQVDLLAHVLLLPGLHSAQARVYSYSTALKQGFILSNPTAFSTASCTKCTTCTAVLGLVRFGCLI